MCSELTKLIEELSKYNSKQKPKCLNFIINYKKFIQSLININSLIGLKDAKYQVYLQVKSFIVNYRRHGVPINSEKMNILLCGSSGCGKSKLGYYLAQLWGASGCIKTNDGKDIFEFPKEQSQANPVPVIPKIVDNEKIQLRQSLAVRENQILNYRTQIHKTDLLLTEIITSFNNVRKKISAKDAKEENLVQSKLQIIKVALKNLRSTDFQMPLLHKILPVTIPLYPGKPHTFDNSSFPFSFPNSQSQTAQLSSQLSSQLPPIPQLPQSQITQLPLTTQFASQIPPMSQLPPQIPPMNLSSFFLAGLSNFQNNSVPTKSEPEPEQDKEVKFIVVTKGDLVGKYQGHTVDKVRKLLNKYIGGVIMIDEAYSLCTSNSDDYGKEILVEIVNFMSTHPGKIIFIFAGYRDQMNEIFLLQEGLNRRIECVIDIDKYTTIELAQIFIQQLKEFEVHLNDNIIELIYNFFKNNEDKFPQFGGSTEKFAKCVKQILYSDDSKFQDALNDTISDSDFEKKFLEIDMKIIEKGFKLYIQNSVDNVYNKIDDKSREKMHLMYI